MTRSRFLLLFLVVVVVSVSILFLSSNFVFAQQQQQQQQQQQREDGKQVEDKHDDDDVGGGGPVELSPEIRHFDLTGGTRPHRKLRVVHDFYKRAKQLREFFNAAHESRSKPQLNELKDKMIPQLQDTLNRVCETVNRETEAADHVSLLHRQRVKQLNELIQATAMASRTKLASDQQKSAAALRDSEEDFASAKTVSHLCQDIVGKLDQLSLEIQFSLQTAGADLVEDL